MSQSSFIRAVLVLPVSNMKVTTAWYENVLGLETIYLHNDPVEDPDGNYAILRRDGAEIHLILDEPPRMHPWSTAGTGYLFLLVKDIDAVFDQVKISGVEITREISKEDWGARAFLLTDPSGNLIRVAEEMTS